MGIDFNDKILITNPTTYGLGLGLLALGLIAVAVGIVTYFVGDFLIPATGWCALGVPTTIVGGILMGCGLTKR